MNLLLLTRGFGILILSTMFATSGPAAELPPEQPLWPEAKFQHRIDYDRVETVRRPQPPATSPSGSNRVYSYVSQPTYCIHRAPPAKATGVGLVICPGGGYRDVWLDREGHDLGIWLQQHGITSLVLKYRTNSGPADDDRKYGWDEYMPAVVEDGRQAIRVLRRQAASLNLDPVKIGICGFSAGGHLALSIAFHEEQNTSDDVSGAPNFAGLLYPWLREEYGEVIQANATKIPPLFIMNARDDTATPADLCVVLYGQLLKAGVNSELHIFGKGGHGFDLGEGRGESAALWKRSFVAWLRDTQFTK